MNKHFSALLVLASLVVSGAAHAMLLDRGGGMIYDDALNITWLQDANYAKTSGYDSDGLMTWAESMAWASNLVYGGHDDWRLPTVRPVNGVNFDLSYSYPSDNGATDIGFWIGAPGSAYHGSTASEMAYMYYINLGGTFCGWGGSICLSDISPFLNLENYIYWSGVQNPLTARGAFSFDFRMGFQNVENALYKEYAWAVRDGDVGAVPEPAATTLLALGLLGLGYSRKKMNIAKDVPHGTS